MSVVAMTHLVAEPWFLPTVFAALGGMCLLMAKGMHLQAFGPDRFEGCTSGYLRRMWLLALFGALQLVGAAALWAFGPT